MTLEKAYIILGFLVFFLGLFGAIIRKNLITILICTEIMLTGANIILVTVDSIMNGVDAQILSLFVLTVAAAEVAIGLGLVMAIFRLKGYEGSSEITHLRD